MSKEKGLATHALHAGDERRQPGEPVTQALNLSTSFFTHPDSIGFSANDLESNAPHFYSRWSNPTLQLLETRLAVLDAGEAAVCFASGMAAISALFLDCLSAGDHLVISDVCYAGVAELARDILPKHGITVTVADTSDPSAIAAALQPTTRLVHVETPANPTLKLSDIAALAPLVHANDAELSVDATIATPLGMTPLTLGADYVVHSLTKYISGHGDALGGVVIGKADRIQSLRKHSLIHLGGVMSPFNAWLTLRGLETLVPRMRLHEANAGRIEAFLAGHPRIRTVFWPGSQRHPQHDLAKRQMRCFSGLLSFSVKDGSLDLARKFAERLKVFSYAVSLGKTKSLLFYIPTEDILRSSFSLQSAQEASYRQWAGEGLFRVSAGLEDADDLINDLDQVLS